MLPRPYLVLSFGVIHFIKKLILYRGFSPQKMKGYRTLYSACCTHQVLSVSTLKTLQCCLRCLILCYTIKMMIQASWYR